MANPYSHNLVGLISIQLPSMYSYSIYFFNILPSR